MVMTINMYIHVYYFELLFCGSAHSACHDTWLQLYTVVIAIAATTLIFTYCMCIMQLHRRRKMFQLGGGRLFVQNQSK